MRSLMKLIYNFQLPSMKPNQCNIISFIGFKSKYLQNKIMFMCMIFKQYLENCLKI